MAGARPPSGASARRGLPGPPRIVPTPQRSSPCPATRRFFVSRLTDAGAVAVARTEEGVHPVVGLWPLAMAGNLKVALANGLRRASRWAEMQNAAEVFFPPVEIGGRTVDPFFNINRPEDLAEAEAPLAAEANS